MPLQTPTIRRAVKHTRQITVDAYARDDGLWDLDAHLSDVKSGPSRLASGMWAAGEPIHDLYLRLTIDTGFNVVGVEAESARVPYEGYCDTIGPRYECLSGLNLMQDFRRELLARVGGTAGCTHLTALAAVLPTVAIQAFAGEVIPVQDGEHALGTTPPFQLDRCHALRTDGPAVAKYYPRWARSSGACASPETVVNPVNFPIESEGKLA